MIISKSLNYKRHRKLNDFDEELIVINVMLEKMTIAITGWYVPPRKYLNNLIFNELESNHPKFLVIELGNRKSNQSGKNLIDQINGSTLTILNDNSHTFKIDSRNYSERLDLAIASQSVTNAAYDLKS